MSDRAGTWSNYCWCFGEVCIGADGVTDLEAIHGDPVISRSRCVIDPASPVARRGLPPDYLAPAAVPDGALDPVLDRPRQYRFRQAADAVRSQIQRDGLRHRRGHLLHRLLPVRGAEQPAAGIYRRPQDHRADHVPLGRLLRGDDVRHHTGLLLRPALPARSVRGRLLSGRDPVSHLLVPERAAGRRCSGCSCRPRRSPE